ERPLRVTHSHREGFPCCLLIPLAYMPSPLPRRDRSSVVARDSTGCGLPHRSGGSAPALRVSRSARRSLTLWPACSLTPLRGRFLECFSPSRCLLEPLQVLPAGATSLRAGVAPARNNTPFTAHGPARATLLATGNTCTNDTTLVSCMVGKLPVGQRWVWAHRLPGSNWLSLARRDSGKRPVGDRGCRSQLLTGVRSGRW